MCLVCGLVLRGMKAIVIISLILLLKIKVANVQGYIYAYPTIIGNGGGGVRTTEGVYLGGYNL